MIGLLKKRLLLKTAYHEAGHVVFTYLYNFSCGYTEIDSKLIGEGKTLFEFGSSKFTINILVNNISELFNEMNEEQQNDAVRTAHYLSMIFCAGECVESFYFNSIITFWKKPRLRGYDLIVVDELNKLLKNIHTDPTQNTLNKCTCLIKKYSGLRNAIEGIANGILESTSLKLDKQEIETILSNVNFDNTVSELINTKMDLCT